MKDNIIKAIRDLLDQQDEIRFRATVNPEFHKTYIENSLMILELLDWLDNIDIQYG